MLRLERWTEPLAESNCYLLGEAGRAVVIDPNDPRGPLERLEALGWTPERILLTHEHCDHMAGLEALRNRWPGVRVAAISAAVRYLHAPASVGSLSDFEDMLKLTRAFLEHTAQFL